MLQRVLPTLDAIASLRGQAYALAACAHLLEAGSAGIIELPASWEAPLRRHLVRLERALLDAYRQEAGPGWYWFEPVMTYGNGLLPWALLRAHRVTRNPAALEAGLRSLLFLQRIMTAPEGWFRPVGNTSWATRDSFSRWDQQPLELFKLALALDEAMVALRRLEGSGKDEGGFALANGGMGNMEQRGEVRDLRGEMRNLYSEVQVGGQDLRDKGQDVHGSTIGAAGTTPSADATGGIEANSGTGTRDGRKKPPSGGLSSGLSSDLPFGGLSFGGLLLAEPLPALSSRRRIPAEVRPLPSALAELREPKQRCLLWFHGHNDLGVPMADPWDGSCSDGLQPDGPNHNCGAEATLSYLMTRALCLKDGMGGG